MLSMSHVSYGMVKREHALFDGRRHWSLTLCHYTAPLQPKKTCHEVIL